MTRRETREDQDLPAGRVHHDPGQQEQEREQDDREHHDWEWRRRIRSNAHAHRVSRVVVAVVGLVIAVGGLILVPAPGPGWLIVLLGLAVLASEFEWAQRVLHFARRKLDAWTDWIKAQAWWVKVLVSLATLALVLAVGYAYLRWQGPPGLLPDGLERWLTSSLSL